MPSGAEHGAAGEQRRLETRMTSDERIELVRSGLEQWREGFLAYLLLPDVDLSDRRMTEQFVDSYAGWYPDRRSCAEDQVASLGWRDALDAFSVARGVPTGALDLDWDKVWQRCTEAYSVVERLGGVHLFMR